MPCQTISALPIHHCEFLFECGFLLDILFLKHIFSYGTERWFGFELSFPSSLIFSIQQRNKSSKNLPFFYRWKTFERRKNAFPTCTKFLSKAPWIAFRNEETIKQSDFSSVRNIKYGLLHNISKDVFFSGCKNEATQNMNIHFWDKNILKFRRRNHLSCILFFFKKVLCMVLTSKEWKKMCKFS